MGAVLHVVPLRGLRFGAFASEAFKVFLGLFCSYDSFFSFFFFFFVGGGVAKICFKGFVFSFV